MIATYSIATAFLFGFVIAEIILIIQNRIKASKYQNHIKIQNVNTGYAWLIFIIAVLFLTAVADIFLFSEFDSYSENIERKISIAYRIIFSIASLIQMIFGRTAYITENGICGIAYKIPKGNASYSIKKIGNETLLKLFTKSPTPDITYALKNKTENEVLELAKNIFPEYSDSLKIKKNWHRLRYTFFNFACCILCTSALIAWYFAEMPVIFVKNAVVPTNSEWALFENVGYWDLMFTNSFYYYDDFTSEDKEMIFHIDHLHDLTPNDLEILKKMPYLKHINVAANNIDDLTVIGELTQLKGLAFGGGKLYKKPKDYSPLENLTELKYFMGFGLYNFNDLTVFENADDLAYFELTMADIQGGLEVIGEKKNLLVLELYSCTAEDFSHIGNCVSLKELHLSKTNITDLSFLKNLTELEYLNISYTNAEDYSVLLEMPSLKKVSAAECNIPNEIIEKLTEKGVEIYT